MTWKLGMLGSEALRNLSGARARTAATILLVAGMAGAVGWSEYDVSSDILEFQKAYTQAGGYVAFAVKTDAIEAARCERLADGGGVLASGGVAYLPAVTSSVLPDGLTSLVAVTPGMVKVDNPGTPSPIFADGGYLVTRGTAETLGLIDRSWVQLSGHAPATVQVVDLSDRGAGRNTGFETIVSPTGKVDMCAAEYSPGSFPNAMDHLAMVFADAGKGVAYNVYRLSDEFTFDPVSALANRSQTKAWFPVGLILVVIGWLSVWFRRSELALYTAFGSRRSAVALMVGIEFGVVVLLGWIIGTAWSTAAFQATADGSLTAGQIAISLRNTGSSALLAIALTPVSALAAGSDDVAARLKDR